MQRSSVRVIIAHGGVSPASTFFTDCLSPASAFYCQGQSSTAGPSCRVLAIDCRCFSLDHNFYWMYPAPSEESSHVSGCPMVMNRVQQADYQWQLLVQGVQLTPVHNSRQPVFQAAQKWLTNQFSSATWQSAPVTREFSLASSLSIRQDSSDYHNHSERSLSI